MKKGELAELYLSRRVLVLGEKIVPLNIHCALCLKLLIERQDNIISKEEIMAECWEKRGQFVTDSSVRQIMFQLRKALNDLGVGSEYLTTVGRKGYRLKGGKIIVGSTVEEEHAGENEITSEENIEVVQNILPASKSTNHTQRLHNKPDYTVSGLTQNKRMFLIYFLTLVMAIMASVLILHYRKEKLTKPIFYSHVGDFNGLHVYQDKRDIDNFKSISDSLLWLQKNQYLHGRKNEYIYINQRYSNRFFSAFVCDGLIENSESTCYSLMMEDRR